MRGMGSPYLRLLPGLVVAVAVVVIAAMPSPPSAGAAGLEGTLEGVLSLVWGDGSPDAPGSVGPIPTLTDDAGQSVVLELDADLLAPLGGPLALNGLRVSVHGTWSFVASDATSQSVLDVDFIAIAAGEAPEAVTAVAGSQPWVSIMCRFPDVGLPAEGLSYFLEMYSSSYPGLDHYWREVSYGNINVAGSGAYGWYTLPNNKAYYVPGGVADLDRLFSGCTGVADPDVDFSDYVGINLMFNDTIGPYAWGGTRGSWRVTWEPPWGWREITVMSHEMGHGFGLPHSAFNDTSDPWFPYINEWDVMSDSWSPTLVDPTYGELAQHTISYHKDILGWFRNPEKITVAVGNSTTVALVRLALPYAPGPKMVRIPIANSSTHFYTVEARSGAGYDLGLAGDAVIVHDVLLNRVMTWGSPSQSSVIPALVQGSNGGTGAMGTPGEYFRDTANSIGIAVLTATDGGFEVAVTNGSALAASYTEVDAASAAGTSSNLNSVFEPGESVLFAPSWANASPSPISPAGSLSGFTGPGGASYTLADASAAYGSISPVTSRSCTTAGNCYRLTVSNPASRPAAHWDATVTETLSAGAGSKTWNLHIGASFDDVSPSFWAYRYIESMFHHGVTTGCDADSYCPGAAVSRTNMALFLGRGLRGDSNFPATGWVPGMGSFNCSAGGASVFADVAPTNWSCGAVHYIASRQVTLGCGGGNFCPYTPVSRWQMALFLARAMTGADAFPVSGSIPGMGSFNCSSGGQSVFSDISPTDYACAAIHFLASQGVTTGCAPGQYCPSATVNRSQMAAFVSRAFGLDIDQP